MTHPEARHETFNKIIVETTKASTKKRRESMHNPVESRYSDQGFISTTCILSTICTSLFIYASDGIVPLADVRVSPTMITMEIAIWCSADATASASENGVGESLDESVVSVDWFLSEKMREMRYVCWKLTDELICDRYRLNVHTVF